MFCQSAWDLIVDADINTQLLPENLSERAAVPQIYPVSNTTTLLVVHALLCHNPIEALGPGYRGAEPNLLVRGLLVQDKGVFLGRDFENSGLFARQVSIQSDLCICTRPTYRVVDLNRRIVLLCLL